MTPHDMARYLGMIVGVVGLCYLFAAVLSVTAFALTRAVMRWFFGGRMP